MPSSVLTNWSPLMLIVVLGWGLSGCGSTGDKTGSDEWAVQKDAIRLDRTLSVSDNEAFYFGEIRDVTADENGRIYVADGKAHHVKMLGPEGTFIDSLGTRGRGPGEFRRPDQLFFARGDSLFVLDGYYGEISAFGPTHDFAYRLSVRGKRNTPFWVMGHSSGYVGLYARLGMNVEENGRQRAIRAVSIGGTPGDTLFTVPATEIHIEKGDGYMRMRRIPFGRSPHVATGPEGRVHYAWSDSMTVKIYDRTGSLCDTVDIPFEPVPVTEADREQALSGRSPEGKAAVKDEIPPTKPAFTQFLVDDEGRYWFGRPTPNPDSTAWWVARPDERRVMTETLPSEVEILSVKKGQAYGRTTTETGAPAVVRYTITMSSENAQSGSTE